ncbi:hypothetical protein SDC9_55385 [bioreactor metagenome]|uniref:Uncharacterized protein n=1 Tax=bioreactor metagenome TaxID=1076179 RepID=A0A644WZ26_9ZZZZ
MVGEAPGRCLHRLEVLDAEGSKFSQSSACGEGRLYRGQSCARDLRAQLLHDRARLYHAAEGLACALELGGGAAHIRGDARHRARQVVDHIHDERQFEYGL